MARETNLNEVVRNAVTRSLRVSEPPPGTARLSEDGVHLSEQALGEYFANRALLRELTGEAYRVISRELAELHSPPDFIECARDAAVSEARHKKEMEGLASRFGARPSVPVSAEHSPRDLFALALDNATVGCVRETYDAARLQHQSQRAQDDEVRKLLKKAAGDGARQAVFCWDLHYWALSQLSPERCRRIRAAQREAVMELRRELDTLIPHAVALWVGAPDPRASLVLLDTLDEELWDQEAA